MASIVHFREQQLVINNMHFARMFDFVAQVGEGTASSPEEKALVTKLKTKIEGFWPGITVDLAQDFPSVAERKFWARCFHDVARWIFLRKLGSHDVDFWQATSIHLARVLGDLFTEAAREYDQRFYPQSEDARLFDAFYNQNG